MNIGIIGAGATGLTAGYFLSKQGHNVTIVESQETGGGLVSTIKVGDSELERFYHHIFTSDTEIIKLIQELELADCLKWYSSNSGIYINKKMYPFTTPMDLLRFKELSFLDRVSMGLLVFKAKFINDWQELESVNAKDWIIKNSSRRIYDTVWGPLINSKFDVDADKVSAVWIWNKFKLRGSTREKNLNKELLGYLEGGFGKIYKRLEDGVLQNNGEVKYGMQVEEIKLLENGEFEICTKNKTLSCDKLIVTTAPSILESMKLPFQQDYIDRLKKIKYKANICVIFELNESISPYYWTTIADSDIPFVLMIEHTNLVQSDGYKANVVYLSRYLDGNNEMYTLSDNEIKNLFIKGLKKVCPNFNEQMIINTHVNRSRFTQPVIEKEYSNLKLEYKTPIDNLYIANMSQVYPEDRGQNYAIKMGRDISVVVGGL